MIRIGTRADVPALVALQHREPTREVVVLAGGSAEGAARLRAALLDDALARGAATVLVVEEGGRIAGFAEVNEGGDVPPASSLVRAAVRSLGVRGAIRAGVRSRARLRVDMSAPPGGLHLYELHVDPDLRGRGLGQQLLDAVHERASAHVSLTTGIDNPARRLYERNGYEVLEEKRDARYEALTGSPGRVLMVKRLPPPSR